MTADLTSPPWCPLALDLERSKFAGEHRWCDTADAVARTLAFT